MKYWRRLNLLHISAFRKYQNISGFKSDILVEKNEEGRSHVCWKVFDMPISEG